MRNQWTIADVETAELRLILKALGGRLGEEDAVRARALGDALTVQRAAVTRQAHHEASKLLASLAAGQG